MPDTSKAPLRDRIRAVALPITQIGFGAYLLLLPVGNSAREITCGVSLLGLVLLYALDFKNSNLARFPLRWLYAAFLAYLAFKTAHSINPLASWHIVKGNIYQGPVLFLAGLESVRSRRDMKILAGLVAAMVCYEGLDGIWQYKTGHDFIRNTPKHFFRLTGSMSSPRVGNAMVMALPPAAGLFYALPRRWFPTVRLVMTAACVLPGVFLLYGSYTRGAWIGLIAVVALLIWLRSPKLGALAVILGLAALPLMEIFSESLIRRPGPRFAGNLIDQMMTNPRLLLWSFGLKAFGEAPLLGAGIGGFTALGKSEGLVLPPPFGAEIPHPHNIYIQFMVDTGVVGLALYLALALGILYMGWRAFRRLRAAALIEDKHFGSMCMHFWCAYAGYMVTGMMGHSFFRSWWLGMSLSFLGVVAGFTALAKRPEKR